MTVAELRQRMSRREFVEWMLFFTIGSESAPAAQVRKSPDELLAKVRDFVKPIQARMRVGGANG